MTEPQNDPAVLMVAGERTAGTAELEVPDE